PEDRAARDAERCEGGEIERGRVGAIDDDDVDRGAVGERGEGIEENEIEGRLARRHRAVELLPGDVVPPDAVDVVVLQARGVGDELSGDVVPPDAGDVVPPDPRDVVPPNAGDIVPPNARDVV